MSKFQSRRLRITLLVFIGALLTAILGWTPVQNAAADANPAAQLGSHVWASGADRFSTDPLTAAWEQARDAGSYHFTSDVIQTTIPAPTISNVGRPSRTERLYLEGQSDLKAAALEFHLWSEGGSAHGDDSGLAVRTANGKSTVRQGAGDWQESSSFTDAIAPEGDFMAYLAAARDITPHEPETRAGITFTRYSFQIDGPTFAVFVRNQMEAAMRARGELPQGVRFEISNYYHDMTGEGELWVTESGLPLRQILNLRFPEQDDERVQAQIKVDFSQFGETRFVGGEFVQADPGSTGASLAGVWTALQRQAPAAGSLLTLLPFLALIVLVVHYRRARVLQAALSTAVIASMLIGPLLNSLNMAAFSDTQTARAAEQRASQQERVLLSELRSQNAAAEFSPHQNLLEAASAAPALLPALSASAAPAYQAPGVLTVETGLNTDGDGLTDFEEQRIGTNEKVADTDGDQIADDVEVNGFIDNGKRWYTDPLAADTNGDGIIDTLENAINTDGDALPDAFDDDNDNDGVADHVDLAPFVKSGFYSEASPLLLTVENLTGNSSSNAVPTFVDFQVRPRSADQLQFALSLLDWPKDDKGQIQDIDNQPDDMKLVPMLEIRIPDGDMMLPPAATLPPYSETNPYRIPDLEPYQITIGDGETAGEKIAYLPLSLITDQKSGERVAFGGRMRYLPQTAWQPQEVRLVWMVQMSNDVACDYKSADARAQGCGYPGYYRNQNQIIHRYYEDWMVTGLNVTEDHGAKVAVIYEDPNRDLEPNDDGPTWLLSSVLEERFIKPKGSVGNFQREVTIDNLAAKFDWNTIGSGSSEGIYGLPNRLTVTPVQTYPTFDAATNGMSVVISDTVLPAFNSANKPLLMFAYETNIRSVGLDVMRVNNSYAAFNGDKLTIRFHPSGQDNTQIDTLAGLKWNPYCHTGGAQGWAVCSAETYWQELETRYGNKFLDPDTLTSVSQSNQNPDVARAMMLVTQLYALTIQQGLSNIVRQDYGSGDIRTVSGLNPAESDTDVEGYVRSGLAFTGQVAKFAANAKLIQTFRDIQTNNPNVSNQKIATRYANMLEVDSRGTYSTWKNSAALKGTTAVLLLGTITAVALAIAGYEEAADAVNIAIGVAQVALSVAVPIRMTSIGAEVAGTTLTQVLKGAAENITYTKIAAVIGTVIAVGITWGFFIYTVVSNDIAFGSPEFNSAFAEAVAATILIIMLTILAFTGYGLIIVGIITAIDVIFTLFCKYVPGGEDLKTDFTGGCFTLSAAATKIIAKALYNYELMIDTTRKDMVAFGAPQLTLDNPNLGYADGNNLSVTMPITTHAVHKDPEVTEGIWINFYLWLFSKGNLRSSTFKYSATEAEEDITNVERDQITSKWYDVREDHKYVATPMYGGYYTTTTTIDGIALEAGLNQPAKFYHNMGYAIPAYECWVVPPVVGPPVPVCYTRTFKQHTSEPVETLVFDIFPASLNEFIKVGEGLTWDPAFRPLQDADGDGLLASRYGGLDPNDTTWDTDKDGLADSFELEQRQAGINLSPTEKFSDGDGLTDAQELRFGTNPAVADSDNDGLLDHEEVWHEVYDLNTGQATGVYAGGVPVTINGSSPFTVQAVSNPNAFDTDGDGVSDGAEYQLARENRVDENNVPFHPSVFNTPPIRIYMSSDAVANRYVEPGQQLVYTTTVVATEPLDPGVLDVDVFGANSAPSGLLGQSSMRYGLPFNPLSFSTAQTLTQQIAFTVDGNATTNTSVTVNNRVRTQLEGSGPGPWQWSETGETWNLAGLAGGNGRQESPRYVTVAPSLPDRQNAYVMLADANVTHVVPEERMAAAQSTVAGQSALALETFRGNETLNRNGGDVACNDRGNCMYVWEREVQCRNMTINSLTVEVAGSDGNGSGGIEPVVFHRKNSWEAAQAASDANSTLIWNARPYGNNMSSGDTVSAGFPQPFEYCQGGELVLYESDEQDNIGTSTDWSKQRLIQRRTLPVEGYWNEGETLNVAFAGDGRKILLNMTVGLTQVHNGMARVFGPDGVVIRDVPLDDNVFGDGVGHKELHNPVVASDGEQFLVAWERIFAAVGTSSIERSLVTYDISGDGVAEGTQTKLAGSTMTATPASGFPYYFYPGDQSLHSFFSLDVEWIGDRYRVVHKFADPYPGDKSTVSAFDVDRSGVLLSGGPNPFTLTTGVNNTGRHAFDFAYDPVKNRTMLVYTAGSVIGAKLIAANGAATSISVDGGIAYAENPKVVYNPITAGWLVSWEKSNVQYYRPLDADGSPLTGVQQTNQVYNYYSSALACPLPVTAPAVDLRFEELPDATLFADDSGYGNDASCSVNTCPAAGAAGAPDAPLSAYALEFGSNDVLTLAKPTQLKSEGSFTVAFWYKAGLAQNGALPFVIESNQPNGFGLFMRNNSRELYWYAGGRSTSTNLYSEDWNFIVGTYDRSTGLVSLYVNGNLIESRPAAQAPVLDSSIEIRLEAGGANHHANLDHLQIYPSALGTTTVKALYDQENQAYCVAARANGTTVPWSKLRMSRASNYTPVTESLSSIITVDDDAPSATVVAAQYVKIDDGNSATVTVGGSAHDPTSAVAKVEVSVDGNAFQPANGRETWTHQFAVSEGPHTIEARATDIMNNLGGLSPQKTIIADGTPPQVTINAIANPVKPVLNGDGNWQVTLSGMATDPAIGQLPGSGVYTDSVQVLLTGVGGAVVSDLWQTANYNDNSKAWAVDYVFPAARIDVSGVYTVSVRAEDRAASNGGNNTGDDGATAVLQLDHTGPSAALSPTAAARQLITEPITIDGPVTSPLSGIATLEVAFTPIEQIAALPNDVDAEVAQAQLDAGGRTWLQAALLQQGAGITSTTWSLIIPANLEGEYQLDLRATDTAQNKLVTSNAWRGIIDTQAPRVSIVRTNTGSSYTSGPFVQPELIQYQCVAEDRYLSEPDFTCPSNRVQEPTRIFNTDPLLQTLFPDRTILKRVENTSYRWETESQPETIEACDLFGKCATASTGQTVAAAQTQVVAAAAVVAELQALVISPVQGRYVAADGDLPVTIVAEAPAPLQQVTIELDNSVVHTYTFDQNENITNVQRTVAIPNVTEGVHTLVAKATDWTGAVQTTLYPVTFTLDAADPAVTLDTDLLRLADTWALGSDMLRFNGAASDNMGLAAVQIKIGDAPFVEAGFDEGNSTWRTAQLVPDPEGKTLAVTVRAIDRAGRITDVSGAIGVDLTPTETTITPPDTTITPTVVNPGVNSVSVSFAGVDGTNEVAAYECRLDGGPFKPCVSPQQFDGLNNGVNHFEVRAIDYEGFADPSPAAEDWTIATALQTTITEAPGDPTFSRDANFVFSGANSYECSLDGAAYIACNNGTQSYTGLRDGPHTFRVRGLDGSGGQGAATRFTWTISNAAPVANAQTVTVDESSSVTVTLSAGDADALTYKVGNPTHGVLLGAPPMLTYSPDSGYFGTDSFTFVANDGLVDSNVATVDITIQALDRDVPTTTITLSPDVPTGLNGWYTSTMTVTVSATDGDDPRASGVAETRCVLDPATQPLAFDELPAGCDYADTGAEVATDGQHTTYAASRDGRNNRETPVSLGFQIDMTAPTISATGVPGPNGAGWNNSDVTVQFTCDDGVSGVASCTGDQAVTTEAADQIVSGAVADNAGNAAAATLSVSLDKTAPTIAAGIVPAPNGAGWSNGDVTVQFNCADTLSGVASCAAEQAVTAEGASQSISGDASDFADNAASTTINVNLDRTPPTVTCSANPDRLWPPNNKLNNINVAVNVEDALSGPAGFALVSVTNDETTDPNDMPGWEIATADTAGQLKASRDGNGDGRIYTLTYEGMDVAGNTALCSTIVFVPHDQKQPNPSQPTVAAQVTDTADEAVALEDEVNTEPEEGTGPEARKRYLPALDPAVMSERPPRTQPVDLIRSAVRER